MMYACLDVHYTNELARAACLTFSNWESDRPNNRQLATISNVAPYRPGQFYKRELPCLLAVLDLLDTPPQTILVDGYVWLGRHKPGLGHYLYEALDRNVVVIGVAKTIFHGAGAVTAFSYRGKSESPLAVTSIGIEPDLAADAITRMHGAYRIPTLLKQVDRLARDSNELPSHSE